MGTICAAAYTNIFMASFKSKFIYPQIKEKVITFSRFIDDLFNIRTDIEEELLKFINELNIKPKAMKSDFKYSETKIEFLAVLVYKDVNNKLQTTLCKNQPVAKAIYMQTQNTRDH